MKSMIIRFDDVGMNHTVNQAAAQLAESGHSFSASVMFACPWYQEAVALLKRHPRIGVGVHLTLNSEWQGYRWGSVAGASAVPCLVDEDGLFPPSHASFEARLPELDLGQLEVELRAQIGRALRSGLQIDYLDHHMGTVVTTLPMRQILEKLAAEHKLGISRYFNEDYQTLFDVAPESKSSHLAGLCGRVSESRPTLGVMHIGLDTPEMDALVDMDSPAMKAKDGASLVRLHRHAEFKALMSAEFKNALKAQGVALKTYREWIGEKGLDSMLRPAI